MGIILYALPVALVESPYIRTRGIWAYPRFPVLLHQRGSSFATLGKTNPIGKRGRMTHTAPQPADQPVFKNAAYTQEYIDIAESLDGDIPGRRAARS